MGEREQDMVSLDHENMWLLQNRIARIFNVITEYGGGGGIFT